MFVINSRVIIVFFFFNNSLYPAEIIMKFNVKCPKYILLYKSYLYYCASHYTTIVRQLISGIPN